MRNERFEWDDDKNATNHSKHGVWFEYACRVFGDAFAVAEFDDREDYGEDRYTTTGMVGSMLITVAHTDREDRIRIISARRANRQEHDDYYRQNQID